MLPSRAERALYRIQEPMDKAKLVGDHSICMAQMLITIRMDSVLVSMRKCSLLLHHMHLVKHRVGMHSKHKSRVLQTNT